MSTDSVAEVKSRLNIEDVVAGYFPLKKAGKYLKANCPFHQEKTPSFFVNPERQIAYCFSCQKGGDLFEFIQEIEGLDFRASLELMAEKAGVELPKFSGKPRISKDEKERLRGINEATNAFFVNNLWKSDDGSKVLEYLKGRGLTDETLKYFKVGLAPKGKDELYRYLLEKKYSKDDLLTSTVVVSRDSEGKQIADRFHLRLMIPIQDAQANPVAFGGRALKKGENPKYLNSPEYSLYNKSATLYNMSGAKSAIRDDQSIVVVEGYFDVMASHQAGIKNVVATCGTALTEDQFRLMKRYSKKIYLAFDSDAAGQAALLRAVEVSQTMDIELYVVSIPEGKDAADAVKEDPQLWVDAVKGAIPYLQFYIDRYAEVEDLSTAEGKKHYTDLMFKLLKAVKHPVERDHYLKLLAQKVGVSITSLYEHLSQFGQERKSRARQQVAETKVQPDLKYRVVLRLVSLILAYPNEYFELWSKFKDFDVFSEEIQNLPVMARFDLLTKEKYEAFYKDFEEQLKSDNPGDWHNLSSIYKQVSTYYNHRGQLDPEFFQQVEDGEKLNRLAFEIELKASGEAWIREEFKKLIARLYFL
jgi:DNA primase